MAMAPKQKRVSEVYQFFKQREGCFICEIENDSGSSCRGKIAVDSGQVTNMTRHVMRSHDETYKNMLESKVEASPKQAVMGEYLRSSKVKLTISKEQFEKDLVGMVLHSGLPLFSFSGPPFKSTLGAIASSLRVSLHRDNIRQLIINEATKKSNELKKILEEK